MRFIAVVRALSVVVSVICWIGSASAQGQAPTDDATSQAKALFKRGSSQYALGRYAEAAVTYEKAYELKQDGALLYNAAQAHRLAGNKPRAVELYQNYLRFYGDKVTASQRNAVQKHIEKLNHEIAMEPPPVATATTAPAPAANPSSTVVATPAPAAAVTTTPARDDRSTSKKRPAWFWPVIGTSIAVVAVGLGVGLGIGLTRDRNPTASLGSVSW